MTGHGLGRQSIAAVAAEGGEPAADTAGIDAEEIGDLWRGVPVVDALDGEAAAVLQDSRGASGSHAGRSCKPQAERALLSSELIMPEEITIVIAARSESERDTGVPRERGVGAQLSACEAY